MLGSDSDENEEEVLAIDAAYAALEISAGLACPSTYCTAVQELTCIISSLYNGRSFTKEARRLVAVDAGRAIALLPVHSPPAHKALQALMAAVERALPQAKRGALQREYRQSLVLARRASGRQQACSGAHVGGNNEEELPAAFGQLPAACVDAILSQLGPLDLARTACVSRSLRQAAADDALWRPLLALTFGSAAAAPAGSSCCRRLGTAAGGGGTIAERLCPEEDANSSSSPLQRRFAELATFDPGWLLPWRTRRVAFPSRGAVRWLSDETRLRIMGRPGPAGVAWNPALGIVFLTPSQVVVWLDRRTMCTLGRFAAAAREGERAMLARVRAGEGAGEGAAPRQGGRRFWALHQ